MLPISDHSRLIERIARALDDCVLYNRDIRPTKMGLCGPSLHDVQQHRRENPSERILRAIDKFLARRRTEPVEADEDIIVDRHGEPWSWRHDEIDLRAACFE